MSSNYIASSITHLPTEILQEIFSTVIQSTTNQLLSVEFDSDQLAQLLKQLVHEQRAVCNTCSGWRAAAISYPPLWTCIPLNPRRWALECLGRSKSLPVAFFGARGWRCESDDFSGVLFSEPGRIRQVAFLDDDEWMNQWITLLPSLCPALETLYLGAADIERRLTINGIPPSVHISALFSLPNLRRLRVSQHRLDWESKHPFTATWLTSLTINLYNTANAFYLFSLLKQTTALQSLVITESSRIYFNSATFPAPDLVHLADLTYLRIEAHLYRCVDVFLPSLRYPESAALNITVSNAGLHHSYIAETRVLELMKFCRLTNAPTVHRLSIRFGTVAFHSTEMTLAVWDNHPGLRPSDADGAHATVCFVDTWPQPPLAHHVFTHLSTPNVERLSWTSEHPNIVGGSELCNLVRGMPKVRYLAMAGYPTIRSYTPLFVRVANPTSQRARPLYLPSLSQLELSGVDFTTLAKHLKEVHWLDGILADRKKNRAPIVSLYLRDCVCIGREVLDELEQGQVVKEVIWDGKSAREWALED